MQQQNGWGFTSKGMRGTGSTQQQESQGPRPLQISLQLEFLALSLQQSGFKGIYFTHILLY